MEKYETPEDQRMVRVTNQSGVMVGIVILAGTFVLYFLSISINQIVVLSMFSALYLSIPLVNRHFDKWLALAIIFVGASSFVFWESATFGFESHTHYGFILIILGAILNLYKQYNRLFWFTISFSIALVVLLYITDFSLFLSPNISPYAKNQLDHTEFILLLLMVGLLAQIYANNQLILIQSLNSTRSQLETNNQALTKANQELDQFVYSVSHDLRAPIASVLGLIDISLQENNINDIKKYLLLKQTSLHKLDGFISELIDYSRNSRLGIQPEEINWEHVIQTIVEDQNHSERAVRIAKTVKVDQPSSFISDRTRIRIILQNLISNSIRYSNLKQEKPYLKVSVVANDQNAILEVRDNGIGIREDHLPHIFDMFFRARENNVGSGLGLYIVKEAVEKIGGELEVQSQIGEGTTFTVVVPNLTKGVLE